MQKSVEMIKSDINIVPTSENWLNRASYAYNVPKERITFVKAGKTQRKNEAIMSDTEKNAFINGVANFNNLAAGNFLDANYRQTVAIHGKPHRMHGGGDPVGAQRFLVWHRLYLTRLETAIQYFVDKNFFIPYWDWTTNPSVPNWLKSFTPTVLIPDQEIIPPPDGGPVNYNKVVVFRTPGQQPGFSLPTSQDINNCLGNSTYTDFTLDLEYFHNHVHMWVGGPMTNPSISPADPLFWLHHANIDRIWSVWQTKHPGLNPNLSGNDTLLDPWWPYYQNSGFGYAYVESYWRTNPYAEYV
jgi:tyrosinase